MNHDSKWEFHAPVRIYSRLEFPEDLKGHLKPCPTLFITTPGSTQRGITRSVENLFSENKIPYMLLDTAASNPSFTDLKEICEGIRDFRPGHILALGGGSAMDLGKILSWLLAETAPSPGETLEMLSTGTKLPELSPIPLTACPTTAGTGSEVTPFATLWDMDRKKKYSLASDNLHPEKALLFPGLSCSLPWKTTLSTGLDALSQCLESVWNVHCSTVSLALAAEGISLVLESLPPLKNDPGNTLLRTKMLEASLLSGLCIASTRTAMAHAISYPLTAHLGTPHGIACSFTLPELWAFNLGADDGRMADLARRLGEEPDVFSEKIFLFMEGLGFRDHFRETVSDISQILDLAHEMHTPGRSDNNLRQPEGSEHETLLKKAALRWM
ncbi:alcohol dehydrogenase [Desulfobotulus alkaliphilus]|uniref:Alcohol dehydrogenase n=1 Tax=Desulfobotulus alkaliphilus TaxID=622671 RepID=A0A562RAI4_9BACT|nr:phosphonoacetaldehyde reductase [Desulfobotulus alkaliphilus]TWI66072.1 alcohol dehydrogenase [Desulfobotulus alkaliphilus]